MRQPRSNVVPTVDSDLKTRWLAWFAAHEQTPTEIQRRALELLSQPTKNVLLVAPTGAGKTHAALLPVLLTTPQALERLRVLVIVPVRALAEQHCAVIHTLAASLAELKLTERAWSVGIRTGDATPAERTALLRAPPDVLVTTPESLCVLLAGKGHTILSTVETVILDEVHQLASGKRGALLAAMLEVLAWRVEQSHALRPRRIGLSATVSSVTSLSQWLGGHRPDAVAHAVQARVNARDVRWISTGTPTPFPAPGWTTRELLPAIARTVATESGTTMLFVHARARAEQWTRALGDILPARMPVACFHSSMSAERRMEVAVALHEGQLKAVIATSSLEVGLDVSHTSQVILIGSPSTVTQLVQSAGRSQHRPTGQACVILAPLSASDILFSIAARDCAEQERIEEVDIRCDALDVAVQAIVTMCTHEPVEAAEILSVLRCSHVFATLSDPHFEAIIDFLCNGGDQVLGAYPEAQRLLATEHGLVIASARALRHHLQTLGTILDTPMVRVLSHGSVIGELDGRFAATLDLESLFLLAGKTWRVMSVHDDIIEARIERSPRGALSRWQGASSPRSELLAQQCQHVVHQLGWLSAHLPHPHADNALARAIAEHMQLVPCHGEALARLHASQRSVSAWPDENHTLIELVRTHNTLTVVVFTFAGSTANEALARTVAARIRRATTLGVDLLASDTCVGLSVQWNSRARLPDETTLRAWLDPHGLREELEVILSDTQLARTAFREVVRIAQVSPSESPTRSGTKQTSSSLLYDVLRKFSPSHVLLRALEQTLWNALDGEHAQRYLSSLRAQQLVITTMTEPSPLAIPLFARASSDTLAPGDLEDTLLAAAHELYARHKTVMP